MAPSDDRDREHTPRSDPYDPTGQPDSPHQPPAPRQETAPAPTPNDDSLETNEIVSVIAAAIPGLGQMFLGQTVKGLMLLGLSILTACAGGLISVASVVDAFLVAKAKKRRQVGDWEFFPDFKETFNL